MIMNIVLSLWISNELNEYFSSDDVCVLRLGHQGCRVSGSGGLRESPVRAKRYAINPLGYKWEHFNITYKWDRGESEKC